MGTERNTQIGIRVRKQRKEAGLSLQAMAEALPEKISFQHLAQYENGVSRWPAVLLSDVAVVLKVDIRRLLGYPC